jgi:nitrate reductase cytochrome c-type subunit
MAQTQEQVGRALVALSVILAVLAVVWLYRWEQDARSAGVVAPAEAGEAGTPLSPEARAGQEAFQKLCDSCHPGGGAGLGPLLLGLDQVIFASATREGVGSMPAYNTARLSDQDLEAMYAYLLTMAQGPATPSEPTATPIAGGPPAIPHSLEGRDQCLGCHASGAPDFPQVPEDHAGRTNDMCSLCHSPAGAVAATPSVTPVPAATATPASPPTATATPSQPPAPDATETPVPEGPPAIPHSLEGRGQCLGCHASGSSAFPQVPEDHAARTNDICTNCHSASVSPAPSPTPIAPVATATPEPEEQEKEGKPEEGPPAIPHTLEGRDQCLGCHGSGFPSFPQVPDSHAGRTNDMCTLCHSSKG